MVKTKTNIYDAKEEDSMQSMIEIAQSTFKELGLTIRTQYLDKTLVEIIGEKDRERNSVTLYHEEDKIYVKLKAQMQDPEEFWYIFESNFQVFGDNSPEVIEEKAKIVNKIAKAVSEMGFTISEENCWDFILGFEQEYKKLPSEEQIKSIALSYVKMCQQQGISPDKQAEDSVFVGDSEQGEEEEDLKVTPTEALKEIILEMKTVTDDDKKFFISLFDDLTVEEQKKLVTRVKAIESDLDKIPYLKMDDRADIRKQVMNLSTEKRRSKILKIIKKRQKNLQKYAHEAMEDDLKKILDKMTFLTDLEKEVHLGRLSEFNVEDKKKYLKRLKIVEDCLNSFSKEGIALLDGEKRTFRDELLRMGKKDREKRLEEIKEEKKFEVAEKELIAQMPAMKFEEHDKLVKEIMWLKPEERKTRISNLMNQFQSETKKKSEVFEGSKVGSTCPKCGWPVGMFSKKCPRCGHSFGVKF